MSVSPGEPEIHDGRVQLRGTFICLLVVGAILGIWHAQLGGRALFTFRNDEPYSSWVGIFFGPLSTLPAVALAMFTRRYSAAWLIAGGLISLGALAASAAGKANPLGEFRDFVLPFLLLSGGPMIALGLGLVWIDHRLRLLGIEGVSSGRSRRMRAWPLIVSSYLLLSVGAFFVADFPLFDAVFETRWGFRVIPIVLGPLAIPALWRFIGIPIYLAETAVFLGLLWLATNSATRRRAALWGALATWIASGLFFLSIVWH
jgi:hypothetical protein